MRGNDAFTLSDPTRLETRTKESSIGAGNWKAKILLHR